VNLLRNYIIIAWRHIRRHQAHSLINIVGLGIGLACSILIFMYVRSELCYDRFHQDAERIYRVGLNFHLGANQWDVAMGPVPLAFALLKDIPGIESTTRIFNKGYRDQNVYVQHGDRKFKEEKFFWADSTIFDVFSIPLLLGNPVSALDKPFSVVITPAMVNKYFGQGNPIGKTIVLEDQTQYTVTAVAKGMPPNSHLKFDFIASFSSLAKSRDPEWYDIAVYTYLKLVPDIDVKQINTRLPEFTRFYLDPIVQQTMGMSYQEFREAGNNFGFFLQPLLDIHLRSQLENEMSPVGNEQTVWVFVGIALLILIVAVINFVNLATAQSMRRAAEVGIRKVVGSTRSRLMFQFLAEAAVISLFSILLALVLVELALPQFNRLIGENLSATYYHNWAFIPVILLGSALLGTLAGSYPGFILASYKPINVLKPGYRANLRGKNFRDFLVIIQFAVSVLLILCALTINAQISYMQNKDLGFKTDDVIVVRDVIKLGNQQTTFKEQLLAQTDIVSASYSDCLPLMMLETKLFRRELDTPQNTHTLITILADMDFPRTYHLQLIQGDFFAPAHLMQQHALLVNEAAVTALGIKNPLNERLVLMSLQEQPIDIAGVMTDFHLESLHNIIGPMVTLLNPQIQGVYLSVRIQPGKEKVVLAQMEKLWAEFFPVQPLEYSFFQDGFQELYGQEFQTRKVIVAFTGLALFIACLGLLGITTYNTTRRTREISMRKVLGASDIRILILLNVDTLRLVTLGNLVAWPIAFWIMNHWLDNFAYRITPTASPFLLSGLASLLFALVAVSFHTFSAAHTDPVQSLKYE